MNQIKLRASTNWNDASFGYSWCSHSLSEACLQEWHFSIDKFQFPSQFVLVGVGHVRIKFAREFAGLQEPGSKVVTVEIFLPSVGSEIETYLRQL